MARFDAVVGELHHVLRAAPVTLLDVVGINTKCPVAVHRTIQHFRPRAAVHGFQVPPVNLAVEAVAKVLEVVGLQVVHVGIVLHIFTHAGTHARQRRVFWRVGVVELVVVVGDVAKQAAGGQQVVGEPQIRRRHDPELIHVEVFRPADGLVQHRIDMEIKARFIDIPALFGSVRHDRLNAFLHQFGFMPQRFAFQMALEAGDVRFRCHLRQVETVLRHADRTDPVRQIVHDDPVGALDPFPRVAIFHLLTGDVQRIPFDLNFRIGEACVVFQQRQLVCHHGVLQDRILRLRLVCRPRVVIVVRTHVVKVGAQREAKHHRIATLVAEVNVSPVSDAINGADVKLALLLNLPGEILRVVITFVLQLQAQRLPGGLIFHTAKQRCRAVEHLVAIDGSRFLIAVIAVAVFIAVGTERVGHVTAGAQIAPSQAEREVERSPGFAGDDVFRIKQTGTADITRANGDLRHPVALFPQTQFDVEGFIFVGLIAREGLNAAVFFGAHVGVAQRGFKPREQLHRGRVVAILVVITVVKAQLTFTRHSRGGSLH